MKLHLPKGLRSAVLACMAVVGGFATTVGTGFVVGGAITIAFSIPQSYADYSWKGGTGDKTAADWNTADNWELNGATFAGSGPGTSGSNMWDAINVGADARVTIGSADSRVALEGWELKLNLEKNATLYATTNKFQGTGTTAISVNNDSHLYLKHNNGHFQASTINIGANSSLTLQITAGKDNGAMTLNLNDSTSKMTFTADAAYTLSGAVNVKSVALNSVEPGTWGTKDLGLTLQNVTLSNLNIDLGEGWTRSSVEITEDNYVMFGGMYSIIVEDGVYKLAYSTAAALTACEWTGGDLSWGVGSAFTGATTFANGAEVSFTTANADVTLASDIFTKHLSVAENVEVGISGEYKVTALDVAVASGAKLGLSTVGNALGTVDLSAGGTLVLSPGKEATLAEVIGADTVINGGTLTISGAGTNITSTGNKLAGVVVNVDGGTLTFNEAFQNLLQKDVTISNGGKIKVTVDGSSAVNDLCAWTTNQNISILSGGEMDLGTTRFSFGGSDKMILNNGTLSGAGSLEGGAHAGVTLHVYGSVEMEASNGSALAANARIQSGVTLTINTTADGVDAPALTISGAKDAGFLKNEGTLKKVGAGTLVINTSCTDNNGVIIAEAGTLAIKGSGTSAKNITVLDGATLVLDGAVTLAGTNSLAGILSITDTATLAGSLTLGDTAEIDLSDWVGGDTYQLFNLGEGANITPALVKVAGREGSWMLNIDGALVESADLHWLGGDLTWNADTEFEGGKLIPISAVTFDGDAGDVKATVEGALVTTILSVEEGTNLILSGEGTLASTETYVEGEMTVGTTGNSFGTVEIGSDGTLTIGAAGNNMSSVEMEADASLVIATGGTTTLAGSIGTTNITGGTLGVATGTTLEVADGSLNTQKMDIAGELVISGCYLGADINISGKVTLNKGDGIDFGANNTITIDGGELALGANRQTFGANNKLVLHDGTVTGTGDDHGAVDFYQDGGKITSTGTSSIEAPVRLRGSNQTTQTTTMDVQDGTLKVSTVCHTGGGSYGNLSKIGAGTLAISGSLDTTGAVQINEGVLKMLNGSSATSAITLAGGSLAAEGTATMASLAGSGDITVAADGTLTITNVSCDSFTKKGAGTLAIGTLTGNFVSMNHEGTQTVGTYDLAENAVLSYGKTGNLLKIDALTTAVAVDIFDIDISSGVSLNLGIASSVSKDLISVVGLESYELVNDNGYWKLTSAATELATDWDFNWGAAGLAGAPTSLATVTVAADATEHFLNGAPSTLTGGNGNVIVYGGTKLNNGNGEAPYAGDVWIQANGGQYKAIVGGHWANTWGSGSIAHFNGNTHILVDGATVGTVIGGTVQDGRGPVFTGNSYISIFSGDVTAAIVGAGTNAHGGTTTFTGNTNIFVYVPLATNNTGIFESTTAPGDAIIGGGIKADNQNRNATNIVIGSTNVTIDLSEYTGTGDKFAKKVIGGHFNWNGNLTANINGDTNVTVIGKSGITFTDMIVGGSRVNQGSISTTGTSSVNISGGSTFSSVVAAGSYLSGELTSTVGNTVLAITGGTYNGNLTGGSYVDATGAVSRQGNSTLTVSGGTFSGNIAGASYLAQRATSTSGTSTVSISSSAFTGWVTGGVFTNSSTSVVTIGDVNMSLTDSSFTKLVAGGTFVGGNSTTNTIGDVNIVLDGVTLTEGLYGGVYHYGDSNASTSTVGDVTITLTGDGTISGNIWAAGGIRGNNANITVASTTVKVSDTVAFADGVTLNAGFDKAATDSCVVAVTGDRSLIFTGNADQDRSTVAFAGFNKIGVETTGKTATIGALTATEAITIDGKGTIKLGAAATLAGGATVEGALDMNGQTVTGDVTVEGTLTSKGTSVDGTLTIDNAATLTDAAAATNIAVGTYSNTKGLTATKAISVGTKLTSSAALTATKITGKGSVEITGGTVTLSDTTDAFENTGTTSIAGATLAGTWTADDVTIGAGVTASGTITLANSTINSTITSTGSGSVALSGDVTVGVTGVEGDAFYTHNGTTDANGNGFKSASTDYTLVNGTSDGTGVTKWLIDGTAATNTSYTDGVLTVQTNADPKTYWVNTGIVSYNGTVATYNDTEQSLATTTGIMLNGGTLRLTLTTDSVAAGYISASTKGGKLDVNGQSITQALFGTLEGTVSLTGAGTYSLGSGVTALATNVELGTGWTGTVKMSDVTLTNDAYSAFAKTNLAVTGATTITDKLEMKGGSLTLGGTITADMTALAGVTTTTISWSTGTEGTGFSKTSRAVQLVDVDGTVSVAEGTAWNAMKGATATFNTSNGVLTVADDKWSTVFHIAAGDTVDYTADAAIFKNGDGVPAKSISMNGSTLNLNSELADTMTGGIEVNATGNTISINATELAKGSLSVLDSAEVALTGNGIYDLSADTTLGTGVSLVTGSSGWTGTVKVSDATVSGWDIDTLANGANSTVEISGVTGSLAAGDVDAKVAMAGKLTINAATTTTFKSAVTGPGELVMAADSALTFAGDTSGWNGAITHTGAGTSSVAYTGTGTIANNISNTGTGKLALIIGGTADVIVTGAVDVTDLTNNAGLTLTQDLTLVGQLAGTGSLTGTNLALQGATNTAGDLTLTEALTLGTADVASALTCAGKLTAASIQVNNLANVLKSQTLGGTSMDFQVSEELLSTVVSRQEKMATLLTLTSETVDATAFNGMLTLNNYAFDTAFNSTSGQYKYTLVWDAATKSIVVKGSLNGVTWDDKKGDRWNYSDVPGDYKNGTIPSSGFASLTTSNDTVVFEDVNSGAGAVYVNGTVKAKNITVDRWDETANNLVFRGASDTEAVKEDKVVVSDDMTVSGSKAVIIGGGLVGDDGGEAIGFEVGGKLTVNNGSTLMVAGNGSMKANTLNIKGNYGNLGATTVEGNASVAKDAYLYNGVAMLMAQPVPAGSAAVMEVGGDLTNEGTLVSYPNGTLNVSGDTVNTGEMLVYGGKVTIGTVDSASELNNAGATISIGSVAETIAADATKGSLNVYGDVDNSNGGSITVVNGTFDATGTVVNTDGTITVENGALVATGAVNNDGGTLTVKSGSATTGALSSKGGGSITIGTDDTTGSLVVKGDVDISGGSLTLAGKDTTADISGDLTVTGNKSLKVGEGTGLKVGGDLNADNVTLDFGGDVTVGGDVEIRTLTNNGVFTANGSKNKVHIDTLTNNGTLSVGKETDSVLTGGHLEIGTLSGKGAVNVGDGGSLTIGSETEFTGQLNNLGTLHITTTTLASAQTDAEQTAGDIVGESLSITDAALGYSGGAYKLGDVVTDKLTVDGISPDATRLSMASLKASDADAGGKVTLVLSDVEDGTVTDGSYHLITGSEETPFMDGGIHEVLDLSRYGYNEEGVYDATMATVQSDYMQKLLQLNKYVTFSDVAPTASVALLSGGTSDLYMSISEQTEEMSVWHLDGAHDKTEAGLTVLKDGKLVSDNILDNVQKVVVTGDQTIDLSGERKAVTLNGLTADGSEGAVTLTVSGDGSAVDKATLNTAADGFDGTLNLTKVSAAINGKVPTINADTDTIGKLNVTDSDVNLLYRDTTLGGTMKGGSINFGLGSKELGVGVLKGNLAVVGTDINVEQTDDSIVIAGVGSGKTVIADLDATNGSAAVTLNGIGFNKYFANARLEGGAIVADRNAEYATQQIDPTTSNGEAGAQLIDDMFVDLNPQASMPGSAYAALMDMVDAGDIITDETAAAIAGSSISALGMALSGDVERQLRAIRNRTTSMGVNECVVNEGMPYFNAWFNAEGNRGKLSADGTAPGYTLDSWGGTVGFDVDVNPNLSMGLAITAMYGDFTAEGPDALEGDMDTYYLSLFARYADCAWTHTFVATVGMMDGSVERTVPGMYGTDSGIDGTTFGLMYEVGYVIPLDEDGEACVQPIFNVMLRHASVGSMTEEGAPLGLEVGKQSMTTLTFGLGARLQAVVGESLYNRASIFEARVLAKADVGDRRSEADVGFPYGGPRATVQSAELGAIGLEVGAGLTIPLGDDDGSIFFDASLELRSGYTNVNGTVGYRINF